MSLVPHHSVMYKTVAEMRAEGLPEADLIAAAQDLLQIRPRELTAEEIMSYAEAHREVIDLIIAEERAGRNRKSLLQQLNELNGEESA